MKNLKLSKEIAENIIKTVELAEKGLSANKISVETGLKLSFIQSFLLYPERYLPTNEVRNVRQIVPKEYELDGYEKLYREVFDIKSTDTINMPNDYKETIDYLLDLNNKRFPQRNSKIVKYYYIEGLSCEEIAKIYNLCGDRINQIRAKGIKYLRNPSNIKYLQYGIEFMNNVDMKIREAKKEIMEAQLKIIEKEKIEKIESIKNNDKLDVYGDISIAELNFSTRTSNALKRYNINKISDFRNITYYDLLKIRNIGNKSMKEIIDKLKDYGIKFITEE